VKKHSSTNPKPWELTGKTTKTFWLQHLSPRRQITKLYRNAIGRWEMQQIGKGMWDIRVCAQRETFVKFF